MEGFSGGNSGYLPTAYRQPMPLNTQNRIEINSARAFAPPNPTFPLYQSQDSDAWYNIAPQQHYDPTVHGLGKRLQKLDARAAAIGTPDATTRFHQAEDIPPGCSPCCGPEKPYEYNPYEQSWKWTKSGKLKLSCQQPIVPVPIVQEIHRRDRIIEIPQVEVVDAVQPKVYNQDVQHQVPEIQINVFEKEVHIPTLRYVDREVVVPVITGYTHKFVPKWEIREVPRPVVKYVGEQKIIEVSVPKVKFIDKIVEKEVVVDTIEKKVPKITEIPNYIDTVKYVWKPVEKTVYVENVVPKFNVSLDCPAPLIVPYTVQNVKEVPSVMIRKDAAPLGPMELAEVAGPPGTVRVPSEYINQYTKDRTQTDCGSLSQCFNCCAANENGELEEIKGTGMPEEAISPQTSAIAPIESVIESGSNSSSLISEEQVESQQKETESNSSVEET